MDDKAKHNWAGTGISVSTALFVNHFLFKDKRPFTSSCIGFGMGVLAGALKETVWDKKMDRGVCSRQDFYDTVWGSLVGSLCVRVYFDCRKRKTSLNYDNQDRIYINSHIAFR